LFQPNLFRLQSTVIRSMLRQLSRFSLVLIIFCATAAVYGEEPEEFLVRRQNDDDNFSRCYPNFRQCNFTAPRDIDELGVSLSYASGREGRFDVESVIQKLSQVSIPNTCKYVTDFTNCQLAALLNLSASCEPRTREWIEVTRNQSAFVDYLCKTQLANFQAAQRCLTYDLIAEIACCGIKEFFSSNCSARDTVACVKQKVSSACSPAVAQALEDTLNEFTRLFARGRDPYQPNPVVPLYVLCPSPRRHHGPGGPGNYMELIKLMKFF